MAGSRRRRCPVCGSKQWRKEPSSGLITCSEGHVLENYRNESSEVNELGPHLLRKRTLKSGRKKKEKGSKADPNLYHGDRARYHYFQCLQLILRLQVRALVQAWNLPPDFEVAVRDLWASNLNLLPSPPPAEPYFYRQEQHGEARPQEVSTSTGPSATARGKEKEKAQTVNDEEDAEEDEDSSPESSSPSSSSSEDEGEENPEIAKLLREASESPSSSSSEEGDKDNPQPTPKPYHSKGKHPGHKYDAPVSNVAILMLACWTLRIPVMYMDFIRMIEAYDLPYLDSVRLLPLSLTRHLTKHTVQALSPHYAPSTLQIHKLTSRLAKLAYQSYSVFTPEMNAAPLLWRTVRGLQGNPTLYTLAKKLSGILSIPLTLHHTLAPNLRRIKQRDPSWHKYDNAPVEVSLVGVVIIAFKLVYGLDGKARMPKSKNDPLYAMPDVSEFLKLFKECEENEASTKAALLSSDSKITALDMDDKMLDEYMDFCEKALLPRDDRIRENGDSSTLSEYFPLLSTEKPVQREDRKSSQPKTLSSIQPKPDSEINTLRPGEDYAIYHALDVTGTFPVEFEAVVKRAARFTGVDDDYICGVVERFERRLVRWWDRVRRHETQKAVKGGDQDT